MYSVVLPVYNAEKTIQKTVKSILQNKTKQDFEVIIVNDGSTDGTKEVLQQLEKDNRFKVIHQENKGVSAARNKALDAIDLKSDYVVFVDDSDTISNNYIEEHLKVLKKYPEINLSIAPVTLEKGNKRFPQNLNFRFDIKEDLVKIDDKPNFVQYHLGGTVFRSKVFKESKRRFSENLRFWEDALLINTVILKDKKYGLVKNAEYVYDRNNTSSLSQNTWSDKQRYTHHIKHAYFPLIKKSQELYGEVIPYIQFLLARHYLEYLVEHNQENIKQHRRFIDDEFMDETKSLFSYIDVKTIEELDCKLNLKAYMLNLKGETKQLSNDYQNIKVLIQKIDFKKKNLTFTFSTEAANLPSDCFVYVGDKFEDKAKIFEQKNNYLLGKKVEGDITQNKYSTPLRMNMLFQNINFHILKDDCHFIVKSPSILKRVIRKLKR
ncbi:hypothetical protein BU035_12390 [Staphylococcus simulans]|uniref:glycosyltransferase family 2 protein n=1 Tax=Staphylococcus simulans TaxID=1286 RepID=UPI000D1E83F0|nr:glycosyltransferase family 2 protein [Staphylococcus simulans]PTJ23482.1 hypothetical protein BU035_12390 [Staphylococcus simulans]